MNLIAGLKRGLPYLVIAMFTFAFGCRQKPSSNHDQFVGRWVASYFSDSLSLSNIGTISFGPTEIDIPHNQTKDSITFWNEDVEGNWKYPMSWNGDTLATLIDNEVFYRMRLQDDKLVLTFRNHTDFYTKTDTDQVNRATDLGITVVRLLINRVMSQQTFADDATRKTVQFEESGKISGLDSFVRYKIAVAGDDANIDHCVSVTFFDSNGIMTKLGMKGYRGKVELYSLRLLTEPDEKPWYETADLVYSLSVLPK